MSNRYNEDSDDKGISSSSTSSSVSSSPRHRCRSRSKFSSSESRSSRSNSPTKPKSRSRTRSRSHSRSPKRSHHRKERRHERRYYEEETDGQDERDKPDEDPHEDSNSISSDKISKSVKESGPYTSGNVDFIPKTPPPPRISKTTIQFGKPGTVARPGIHMKLNVPKPKAEAPKKITVASAFNNDSDEEVEEMPPECKMRMRNIGRDTPTSSGPNSFGKTKQGFIDSKKIFEKSLREAAMD